MLLNVFLKDQAEDVALLVPVLILDMQLVRDALGLGGIGDGVPVDVGILADEVDHSRALERLAEVDGMLAVDYLCRAVDLLGNMAEHGLGKVHHAVVVGIGLIQLHQGEFGIVTGVQTLVAKHSAYLIYALKAAYDQALEVQLQGYPELEVLVQSVEVGLEGTRGGAAGVLHQHGGLDLHESPVVQESADRGDDLRTLDEGLLDLAVHDEVGVALAIAGVGIGEAVILLGQYLQRFAQQGHLCGVYGDLSGLGLEHLAADTDDIAYVIFLEGGVALLAHAVAGYICLDAALQILDITEGCLAHDALEHHASGDRHGLALELVIVVFDLGAVVGLVILCQYKGIVTRLLHSGQLLAAEPQYFIKILFHILPLFPAGRQRLISSILNPIIPTGVSTSTASPTE